MNRLHRWRRLWSEPFSEITPNDAARSRNAMPAKAAQISKECRISLDFVAHRQPHTRKLQN
jgi:hypothetical protein